MQPAAYGEGSLLVGAHRGQRLAGGARPGWAPRGHATGPPGSGSAVDCLTFGLLRGRPQAVVEELAHALRRLLGRGQKHPLAGIGEQRRVVPPARRGRTDGRQLQRQGLARLRHALVVLLSKLPHVGFHIRLPRLQRVPELVESVQVGRLREVYRGQRSSCGSRGGTAGRVQAYLHEEEGRGGAQGAAITHVLQFGVQHPEEGRDSSGTKRHPARRTAHRVRGICAHCQ
eukprot:scaffold3205_cov688-Prasinococcus_capsulatus_cf.AAC.7